MVPVAAVYASWYCIFLKLGAITEVTMSHKHLYSLLAAKTCHNFSFLMRYENHKLIYFCEP